MQYSYSCPLESYATPFTTEASSVDEAIYELALQAKNHFSTKHPDIQKTDEEIHNDVVHGTVFLGQSQMVKAGPGV